MKIKILIFISFTLLLFVILFYQRDKKESTLLSIKNSTTQPLSTKVTIPIDTPQIDNFNTKNHLNSSDNSEILSLMQLMHCEKTATCPQDNSDPRASYFLKSKQMLEKIRQIEESYLKDKISEKELQKVALELLTYADGAIKEESLRLLSKLPPHQSIQESVLKMFSSTYDDKLVTPVILELSRYPHTQKIDTIFKNILTHGGFEISKALANAISPFITKENLQFYEEVKNSLPLNSKRRVYLQASIVEAKVTLN